jgi:hypothetical protein
MRTGEKPRGERRIEATLTAADMRARCRAIVEEVVFPAWEREITSGGKHAERCADLLAAYAGSRRVAELLERMTAAGERSGQGAHQHNGGNSAQMAAGERR